MTSISKAKRKARVITVRRNRSGEKGTAVTCKKKCNTANGRGRRVATADTPLTTPGDGQRVPQFARVEDAPPDLQRRVNRRLPWVNAILDRPINVSVARALDAHAEAAGVDQKDIPTRTTALTWVSRYQEFGWTGLLDRVRADAGTIRTLCRIPAALEFDQAALDLLIETEVVGAKGTTQDVAHRVNERLQAAQRRGRCAVIPYPTVWRWVNEWRRRNGHLVHFAYDGTGAHAEDLRLHLGMGVFPAGVLHSFDSSPADEWVRMPDSSALGWRRVRPHVTRSIDVGSRAILTFEVTVGGLTANAVLGVVRRAYVPGENWEGLPTVPVPQFVRADTGPEHWKEVEAALRKLELSAVAPPTPPEARAHIERLHRTLNVRVSVGQLGQTRTSRAAKPEDLSSRELARGRRSRVREERRIERPIMALRTLDEYVEATRCVSVAYNAASHRGIKRDLRSAREIASAA